MEADLSKLNCAEIDEILLQSPLAEKYDTTIDRESAFEKLAQRTAVAAKAAATKKPPLDSAGNRPSALIYRCFGK